MKHVEYELEAPANAVGPADTVAPAIPTRPLGYAVRMAVFLLAVGIVAAMLREHAAPFFMRNPPLNTLILSILLLGIGLSFRAVLSLDPEVIWIQRFARHAAGASADGAPPLMRPVASMLHDPTARLRLSATGMRSVLDGVDSRLDERRDTSRYLIALLIFLGLLGTFWGLLLTASSVGETIRGLNVSGSDPAQMFETLRAGLEAPLSGMGTAFSTSLFGLASSLVLGFLDLQASKAQNRFANDLETWLTGLVRLDGGAAEEEGHAPPYLTALLEQAVENLDELRGRMVRATEQSAGVNTAVRSLGERLSSLTDALRARQGTADSALDAQLEIRALLERIAGVLETPWRGLDDTTRAHLENIDLGVTRLIDEDTRGLDRVVTELRNEIRMLARTLSAIADRRR
jgi:hypothetical protein